MLFLVMPILELFVLVRVAQEVGVVPSLALLVVVSVVGAWLVKREGLGLLVQVQRELASGRLPKTQLVDGFLVLLAGALLLTPGFVTDTFGLLMLFPPTRAAVRALLLRRFRTHLDVYRTGSSGFFATDGLGGRVASWGFVADADVVDVADVQARRDEPHRGRDELGPT